MAHAHAYGSGLLKPSIKADRDPVRADHLRGRPTDPFGVNGGFASEAGQAFGGAQFPDFCALPHGNSERALEGGTYSNEGQRNADIAPLSPKVVIG